MGIELAISGARGQVTLEPTRTDSIIITQVVINVYI